MIFQGCKLEGVRLIIPEKKTDNRGFFARSFCVQELQRQGIDFAIKQCNYSFNEKKGTLRGMHYQNPPFLEKKIVTCMKGKIYDVVVDLRKDSRTYLKWEAFELSEENLYSVYIPEGLAHGFITLEDNTFLFYEMSEYYVKGQERGIRYDDPKIGIEWPAIKKVIISDRDMNFELL